MVPARPGPWSRFDPNFHPSLPPPPPLPPRGRGKGPAQPPAVNPNEIFAEPQGLTLDFTNSAPPRDLTTTMSEALEGLEVRPSPFGTPPQAEQEAAFDLSQLPGIVMPHAAPTPEPVAPAPPAPAAAPPSTVDAELALFFEETSASPSAPEQAVVIGDDFELVREGGDVSEVIADFRAATLEILDLDDHQAHYDLGTTFMEMELFDEAAAEFEIAARGTDFALPSQEMLGYCFLRKGQIELAIRELEKGLAAPLHDDRAKLGLLYNLGIACSVLDRDHDAITHFQRILEVEPDFRDTQTRLERLVQSSS